MTDEYIKLGREQLRNAMPMQHSRMRSNFTTMTTTTKPSASTTSAPCTQNKKTTPKQKPSSNNLSPSTQISTNAAKPSNN